MELDDRTRVPVGTRIQLSGNFLRDTGQVAGGEGSKTWRVVACDCSLCLTGRFVAVDEKAWGDPTQQRHFAEVNTVTLGKPSSRNER